MGNGGTTGGDFNDQVTLSSTPTAPGTLWRTRKTPDHRFYCTVLLALSCTSWDLEYRFSLRLTDSQSIKLWRCGGYTSILGSASSLSGPPQGTVWSLSSPCLVSPLRAVGSHPRTRPGTPSRGRGRGSYSSRRHGSRGTYSPSWVDTHGCHWPPAGAPRPLAHSCCPAPLQTTFSCSLPCPSAAGSL